MKHTAVFIGLCALMLFCMGCGDSVRPPNFEVRQRVIKKITDSYDNSTYTTAAVSVNSLSNFSAMYNSPFRAPYSFAKLGDIIQYKDGVIRVIMTNAEREQAAKIQEGRL